MTGQGPNVSAMNKPIQITAKRADGTYVALVAGLPYHVTQNDPLYPEAVLRGASAPFEPPPAEQVPSAAAVDAERDRRMRSTFVFQGTEFNCDKDSLQRITGAATLAGFAMGAGAATGNLHWHGGPDPFVWIAADNSTVTMDAPTTFEFGRAAARNESAHIFAARALKDMEPIPPDFGDNKWWP